MTPGDDLGDRGARAREAAIAAIGERVRAARKPAPRWLWIAAILVGALGAGGFAAAMLTEGTPTQGPTAGSMALHLPERAGSSGPSVSSGHSGHSGTSGLVIGAAMGIAIGFAIARQRRSHSSRSNP